MDIIIRNKTDIVNKEDDGTYKYTATNNGVYIITAEEDSEKVSIKRVGVTEIKNLSKNYKSHKVIENMNVTFPGGKIIGILGPNGSGKSTLIKMLAGVLQPNTGQILIDGEPVGAKSSAIVSPTLSLP